VSRSSAGVAAGQVGRRQRWFFSNSLVLAATVALAGCGKRTTGPPRAEPVEQSLRAAQHFLMRQQSADGAWRSDVYGQFKDGDALTPLVLQALLAGANSDDRASATSRGSAYLAGMVRADGSIDESTHGLSYPVYTAAGAVVVLSRSANDDHQRARNAWLTYLRQRQLTAELGWQPADQEYGGWGYSHTLPRKPGPGDLRLPLTESNLSATVFALEALRAAGCPPSDPAYHKALVFVQRCQNFNDNPTDGDARFDDGGFFFIYDDPARNKAGVAGTDRHGRERFHSYGSTTADGLRALLLCGPPPDHPRVRAALRWLEQNFRADMHPGTYAPASEERRGAVYYYYCCSVAKALDSAGVEELQTPQGPVRWRVALTEAVLKKQASDGSWLNPVRAVREDDPLVATALAVQALAICGERWPEAKGD
jgi:squalene-hopene/tetraprenyl-beta-curcumene cyclase